MKKLRKEESKMFLEVIKDFRTGNFKCFGIVSKEEMVKKHPYCLDLKMWASGNRLNSRFSLSNNSGRYIYIRTNETDNKRLEIMAKNF